MPATAESNLLNINLDEIIVSGTGLWYGVYFENLYNLNNQ